MGLKDFFTGKTTREIAAEGYAERHAAVLRASAKGFDSFVTDEQQKVDALKARVDGFLADIRGHFRKHGLEAHLEQAYAPRTKFEDLEHGVRRMGIRWHRNDVVTDMATQLGFAFVEEQGGVRIDYLYSHEPAFQDRSRTREVVSDRYDDADETPYRWQTMYNDTFRSMRRYELYDDFVDDKNPMPDWFVILMKTAIKPL